MYIACFVVLEIWMNWAIIEDIMGREGQLRNIPDTLNLLRATVMFLHRHSDMHLPAQKRCMLVKVLQ
jgi:hypothetical protein